MLSISEKLARLEKQKSKLLAERDTIRANRTFKCLCGRRHKFKDCEGIRFWQKAYGSYDEGGWGETNIFCPKSALINRMYFSQHDMDIPYEARRDYDNDLGAQFERIYVPLLKARKNHERTSETIHNFHWGNNEYVAHNYKKYELRVAYIEEMKAKLKGK